jgi:hypothetical protein
MPAAHPSPVPSTATMPPPAWFAPTSLALGSVAAIASAAGVLRPDLYNDNRFVGSGWLGNDIVTLVVFVPVFAWATQAALAGSVRGRLVWLGAIAYLVYNFAFYLFGAAFNSLFLLYAFLFGGSSCALVAGLVTIDAASVPSAPRAVGTWMGLLALFLGGFWVAMSGAYVFSEVVPPIVAITGHPTNLIGALDLALVVPLNALGAWLVWRRRPWAFVLAAIANVKGALYMTALSAATASAVHAGAIDGAAQVALWAPIGLGCLVASVVVLRRC